MTDFTQTLVTSLAVGSLYSLIALGYTMVYGILKFINFAHSDIVVWGAWISFVLAKHLLPALGIPVGHHLTPPVWAAFLVLLLTMTIASVMGFIIEWAAYRPLRKAPRINVLITAIGVSLLLQNVGQLHFMFGASPQSMPELIDNVSLLELSIGGGKVVINVIDVLILVTATTLMLVLEFLVYRTKLGIAMRAVSFSTDHAALMGVPVDRVISLTFVIGAALAAAAGFLYGLKYPSLSQPAHVIWVLVGLKAFVAAVIGGIGNLRGAVLGGFIIAAVEQFGSLYISTQYRDVYVFALLIFILLVRPTGILGSTVREKV